MKFRSYKQVTTSADIEYGEEVDLEGLINLIDWKKAILFGVDFGENTFLEVGEEDWSGLHMVRFSKPRQSSGWKRILGRFGQKVVMVKAVDIHEVLSNFWPCERE